MPKIDSDFRKPLSKDEQLLDLCCKRNMIRWNIHDFRKTHPKLLKSILEAMETKCKSQKG